jgi:hypothetical protein
MVGKENREIRFLRIAERIETLEGYQKFACQYLERNWITTS